MLRKGIITLLTFLFLGTAQIMAQCAMCRATVENNVSQGESTVGAGLNTGILYLMVIPYLVVAFIGYAWYRHSKKESAKRAAIEGILKTKLS